jgi:hypothetical protein
VTDTHDHGDEDEDPEHAVPPHWPDERAALRAKNPDCHIPEDVPFCDCRRCVNEYFRKAHERRTMLEMCARLGYL